MVIVFDGYPDNITLAGTKTAERLRRTTTGRSADIIFNETTILTDISKEKFLANKNNKSRFVTMLKKNLEDSGFSVKQAWEDADVEIVQTAVEISSRYDSVVIVGEDIDFLVIQTSLQKQYSNIYFKKPGKGSTAMAPYSSKSFKHEKKIVEHILFLHAFSGCDTTSAVFNAGKAKLISVLKKNMHLPEPLKVYYKRKSPNTIILFQQDVIF